MNLDGFNAENEDAGGVSLFDLVDDLDVIVWEADPETFDFIFVNRRAVVLLGYEREEWYEPDFWAGRLIHPDDRAQTVAVCRAAVQERRDHFIEYRAVAADGRVVWLRDMIRVITGELGGIQALRGAMLDVTAEKATEAELALERQQLEQLAEERRIALEALQRSEAHYRRLVNTEPYGVFVTDAAGNLLEVNRSGAEIVGREPDELLGTHFSALIHPDSLDYANQMFAQLMSGPARPIEFELKVAHRDGSSRLLSIAAAPIIVDGRAVGVHGAGRDITQERAADARRRLLAVALDNLPDAVSLTDRSLRFVYTNRAHAQLFGYEPVTRPRTCWVRCPTRNRSARSRRSSLRSGRSAAGLAGCAADVPTAASC